MVADIKKQVAKILDLLALLVCRAASPARQVLVWRVEQRF
jgi:hypothetical protein